MCAVDGAQATKEKTKVLEAAGIFGVSGDAVLTIHAVAGMEMTTAKLRRALFQVDTL
ncbi:hypothetical protein KGQ20_12670 [Catenulispora sp. NF23]|uniref:Uncharacterized protein n=1 Tax=Catenulispora pinistramenti TaxID=2705254 RepID=A0ABS5KHM8_9ACTN|nr:hypothetical protein [Catenulispora pinistramenti]MBS2533624.1 hypothetical protein [Catenulispora pinistramenti]MBS2545866.1 hypothetical protein [Catenulispora pinistramenti]